MIPFLFAGGALCMIFMGHGKRIFAPSISPISAPAPWPRSCSACSCGRWEARLRPGSAPGGVGGIRAPDRTRPACTAVSRSSFRLPWSCASLLREPPSSKTVPNGTRSRPAASGYVFDAKLEASAWTTIAKINVFSSRSRDLVTGGCLGRPSEVKLVGQEAMMRHTLIYSPKYLDLSCPPRQGRPTDPEVPALSYSYVRA